ncbi:hypothetical protein MKI84_10550 [Ancylobacter sp. A5.8]|uniref:hypothetical protein n=1 Tax=Ancylobacter gelatini TaxID=2919920 RepID=UPI001F4E260F|nr:hypothetical protein [Ancylobacter gelatini]MCJ8143354.1 hypothetical protein [Ancylobacter gelatini]
MVRDPRLLDQNPVVIDPADVDAVLDDKPTPPGNPLKPPLDEVSHTDPRPREEAAHAAKAVRTVDGSKDGTPLKPDDPRR